MRIKTFQGRAGSDVTQCLDTEVNKWIDKNEEEIRVVERSSETVVNGAGIITVVTIWYVEEKSK